MHGPAHWLETHRRAEAVARKLGYPRACPVALIRLHALDPELARAAFERSLRLDEDTRWAREETVGADDGKGRKAK